MCEACPEMIDHNAVPDRTIWLQERVYGAYVEARPVMGAQDDTTDGHRSAAMGAKLREINRLVKEAKTADRIDAERLLHGLCRDIEAVVETMI